VEEGHAEASAGRVQSVATRMVVERERARMAFRSATWWGLDATLATPHPEASADAPASFTAALVALDGTALATGRDFSATGERTASATRLLGEEDAVRCRAPSKAPPSPWYRSPTVPSGARRRPRS